MDIIGVSSLPFCRQTLDQTLDRTHFRWHLLPTSGTLIKDRVNVTRADVFFLGCDFYRLSTARRYTAKPDL